MILIHIIAPEECKKRVVAAEEEIRKAEEAIEERQRELEDAANCTDYGRSFDVSTVYYLDSSATTTLDDPPSERITPTNLDNSPSLPSQPATSMNLDNSPPLPSQPTTSTNLDNSPPLFSQPTTSTNLDNSPLLPSQPTTSTNLDNPSPPNPSIIASTNISKSPSHQAQITQDSNGGSQLGACTNEDWSGVDSEDESRVMKRLFPHYENELLSMPQSQPDDLGGTDPIFSGMPDQSVSGGFTSPPYDFIAMQFINSFDQSSETQYHFAEESQQKNGATNSSLPVLSAYIC